MMRQISVQTERFYGRVWKPFRWKADKGGFINYGMSWGNVVGEEECLAEYLRDKLLNIEQLSAKVTIRHSSLLIKLKIQPFIRQCDNSFR